MSGCIGRGVRTQANGMGGKGGTEHMAVTSGRVRHLEGGGCGT